MKTTIEMDEVKLDQIMEMTGIDTMKKAVDWALNEALRIATINRVIEEPWTSAEARDAVDPAYDIIAIRKNSIPALHAASGRGGKKQMR